MRWLARLLAVLLLAYGTAAAQNPELRTAHHLDSIRKNPSLLLAFLEDMPKGVKATKNNDE